jgi:hypothetical protein
MFYRTFSARRYFASTPEVSPLATFNARLQRAVVCLTGCPGTPYLLPAYSPIDIKRVAQALAGEDAARIMKENRFLPSRDIVP